MSASFYSSLRLLFLFPSHFFLSANVWKKILYGLKFNTFHFCNVPGSSAHALCRGLISILSVLKCSSIHPERMLRLVPRVERILLNECWQRVRLQQHNLLYRDTDFKLVLFSQVLTALCVCVCVCYPVHSNTSSILHFRSPIKPKCVFSSSDGLLKSQSSSWSFTLTLKAAYKGRFSVPTISSQSYTASTNITRSCLTRRKLVWKARTSLL